MSQTYDCILFTDVTYPLVIYKPLGAYRLANHIRDHGYSCLVVDHFHTFTIDQVIDIVKKSVGTNTRFVGFSIAFFNSVQKNANTMDPTANNTCEKLNYNQAFCPRGAEFEIQLINEIKSINHNCKILIGGAVRISQQISNPRVDYMITGFAESAIIAFLENLDQGVAPSAVKNLWGIKIIDGGSAEDFDFQHSIMKWLPTDVGGAKVLQLDISRGCRFNCKFCDWSMRGTKSKKWIRAVDSLVEELQTNFDHYGIYRYFIQDHTFNDSDYKINLTLEAVRELNFQPLFWCHTRPDLLVTHPARLEKMFEIGVRSMMMGIDTLNPQTAKVIGKGLNPEKIIAELKNIHTRYGNELITHGNFLIGLPEETIDDINKTADRLHNKEIKLHHWSYNAVMISTDTDGWWGSAFDANPELHGYTEDSDNLSFVYNVDYRKHSLMNWKNKHMNFEQAMKIAKQLSDQASHLVHYHEDSMTTWGLMTFSDLTFDDIKHLRPSTVDWHVVSRERFRYLNQYKKTLSSALQ